jgi:hypothetical protein
MGNPLFNAVFTTGEDENQQRIFDFIRLHIPEFFEEYQFVPHDLAFTYKLKGCVPIQRD